MKIPETQLDALLRSWPVACLATHRVSGPPHLVPIVFLWHGGVLWSPVDGKPKREGVLARVVHLRRDPRASILVQRYTADWRHLWWVRLDGVADVVEVADSRAPWVREVEAGLREKYPQYRHVSVFSDDPIVLRVRVERRTSWCASEAVLEELRDR